MSENWDVQDLALSSLLHDIGKAVQRYKTEIGKKTNSHAKNGRDYAKKHLKKDLFNMEIVLRGIEEHMKKWHNADEFVKFIKIGDHLSASQRGKIDRTEFHDWREDEEEAKKAMEEQVKLSRLKNFISGKEVKLRTYQGAFLDFSDYEGYTQIMEKWMDAKYTSIKKDESIKIEWARYLDILNTITFVREIGFSTPSTILVLEDGDYTDLSLYSHSITTSAISTAAYIYSKEKGVPVDEIKSHKFLMFVRIELGGIQKFINILNYKQENRKKSTKYLKGKSIFVNMIMFSIAHHIAYKITKSPTSILYCNGGNAILVLPNTEKTEKYLKETISKIDLEFNKMNVPLTISLGYVNMGHEDLKYNKVGERNDKIDELFKRLIKDKRNRFKENEWDEVFGSRENQEVDEECRFCKNPYKKLKEDDDRLCKMCEGLTKIMDGSGEDIVYGGIAFSKETINNPSLEKIINLKMLDKKRLTEKNGHLILLLVDPIKAHSLLEKGDTKDLFMREEENEIKELFEKNGIIYIFRFIAYEKEIEKLTTYDKSFLANINGDVDSLGNLAKEKMSGGRLLDKSIMFSDYIEKAVCRGIAKPVIKKEKNIFGQEMNSDRYYVGFVGGDDIFLITEWENFPIFYKSISEEVEQHLNTTLSFGVSLFKRKEPIYLSKMQSTANEKMAKSKYEDKDAVCMFGKVLKRKKFFEVWDAIEDRTNKEEKMVEDLSFYYKIFGVVNSLFFDNGKYVESKAKKNRVKYIIYLNYQIGRKKERNKGWRDDLLLKHMEEFSINGGTLEKSFEENLNRLKFYVSFLSLYNRGLIK